MKLYYYGHAAFEIKTKQANILIDPFLENGMTSKKAEDFKEVDYILVTHGHQDHIGSTAEIAKNTDAVIVANAEIAGYFSDLDLKTHSMHIGGKAHFNFGNVKMTPALHGSSLKIDGKSYDGGNPCGYVVLAEGLKIYHAGDTGLSMEMMLLKDMDIDVAILPIGGNFTMDIEDAVKAVSMIRPKKVIPMHYNTFPVIQSNPDYFKKLVEALNLNIEVSVMNIDSDLEV